MMPDATPGRHASAAAEALRAAAAEPLAGVAASVREAMAAQWMLREADDLLPAMEATVSLILAMEAMQEAAKQAEATARAALASSMTDTGCTTLRTEAHTVSVKDGARRVIVTGTVPPELMVPQPDKPDLAEIGRRLRDGGRLDFAELSNGGAPIVQIRNRERKAA